MSTMVLSPNKDIRAHRDNEMEDCSSQESECSNENGNSSQCTKRVTLGSMIQTERVRHLSISDYQETGENSELVSQINRVIHRSRKCVVLTGAGISCNAGIPDFRSFEGLYRMVKEQYPEVNIRSGQDMFDISLFREEEKISVFASFMESLYSHTIQAKPTKTHEFIAHLKNRGKLLRCYTQNIDGLEEMLGLQMSNSRDVEQSFSSQWKNLDVVQLHGDLTTLSCTQCFKVFSWSRYWKRCLKNGELPVCPKCLEKNNRRSSEGKRCLGHSGMLRPNIVLYGENHPNADFITQGLNLDINRGKADLFLIMGTSLKVDGVKRLVKTISKQVHDRGGLVILVNKTTIGDGSWHGIIDYQIEADCDQWVTELKKHMSDFFLTQQQLDKIRQLKREASELRKRQREEKLLQKRKQQSNSPSDLTTPPNSPKKRKTTSLPNGKLIPSLKKTESMHVVPTPEEMFTLTPKSTSSL